MANDAINNPAVEEDSGDQAQTMVEHAQAVGAQAPLGATGGLDRLMTVGLTLTVELGRCRMKISDIVNLGSGSVVELQ